MNWPERKAQRLPKYDYTLPGAYFVTICVHDQFKRVEPFGRIVNKNIILNGNGKIVLTSWLNLPTHYNISLDEFIVMPDHIHGIIYIPNSFGKNCSRI